MQEELFQYFFYQLNIVRFHFQKNILENQRVEPGKDLFFVKGLLEGILIFHQLQQQVVLRQFFLILFSEYIFTALATARNVLPVPAGPIPKVIVELSIVSKYLN